MLIWDTNVSNSRLCGVLGLKRLRPHMHCASIAATHDACALTLQGPPQLGSHVAASRPTSTAARWSRPGRRPGVSAAHPPGLEVARAYAQQPSAQLQVAWVQLVRVARIARGNILKSGRPACELAAPSRVVLERLLERLRGPPPVSMADVNDGGKGDGRSFRIAIAGAGFSGAILARQLHRQPGFEVRADLTHQGM